MTDFDTCRATCNTPLLVALVDVLLHATETKVITFEEEDVRSKTKKVMRHAPFVIRIMRKLCCCAVVVPVPSWAVGSLLQCHQDMLGVSAYI